MSLRRVTLVAGADRLTLVCDPASAFQLRPQASLWGAAPVAVMSRRVAAVPGETVDRVQTLPRTFALPVQVEGTTEQEIDERLSKLASIVSRREVQVLVRRPDGSERGITAIVIDGHSAIEAMGRSGHLQRHVVVPLVLRAYWPYWRGLGLSAVGEIQPTLFGTADHLITVTNLGDVPAWPVWQIQGAVENLHVANLTTGKFWRIVREIEGTDRLRIETDERDFALLLNDAVGYYVAGEPIADPVSSWWPLAPGPNDLFIRGVGAVGTFAAQWVHHWETP